MLPFFRQHGKIIIQKDGIYPYYLNEEEEEWLPVKDKDKFLGEEDFLPIYFDDFCDIDESVTVKDLLGIFLHFEDELFFPFAAYINSIKLREFYVAMDIPIVKGKEPLKNVAFSWLAGFINDHFESCALFDGVIIDRERNVQKIMLDFAEPNQYANAKVIMMEQIEISEIEYDSEDGLPQVTNIIRTGVKHFTLYDVLFAFLRQITCMGDVKDQKNIIKDIDTRIDAYETGDVNKIEDKNEKIDILNIKMQNAIKEENYKMASKYQKDILMFRNGGTNENCKSISKSKKQNSTPESSKNGASENKAEKLKKKKKKK